MEVSQIDPGRWILRPITSVDDMQEAVIGVGLDAVQLSRGPVRGTFAFAADDGVQFSTAHVSGHVSLTGPLSETMTSLGVGIALPPGSRQWMREVGTGGVGIFRAGDVHEAIYTPGTIYACVTIHNDHLEEIAADMGLVLDVRQLGGSRISSRPLSSARLAALQRQFGRLYSADADRAQEATALSRFTLGCLIEHVAREPRTEPGWKGLTTYSRIVARARRYIIDNLESPLSSRAIARAAFASPSTLYRAFHEVLDETPQSFVRKMRLNRIRHDLASEQEARCSITLLANRWGVGELGRFAGWYRELFGELPSETRARRMSVLRDAESRRLTRTA